MYNEYDAPVPKAALTLPKGWEWRKFRDGSGYLTAPSGDWYFGYDLAPYHAESGIEYRIFSRASFHIFYGSLEEFQAYAENYIKTNIIKN